MMRYWKVIWHHDFEEEPVTLFSEIDEEGYETRKVQEYRDQRLLRTDGSDETAEIGLSEGPVGKFEDVAAQPEFSAFALTEGDFEAVWRAAGAAPEPCPLPALTCHASGDQGDAVGQAAPLQGR
ncbi:DUF6881 domain-containing protein [Streptomyces lydicus]|uniref:DUF6881 domain-containing protein n=1 Tax=Streptomyces lydicus TaxID=47763 RepID=UPI000981487D|nr:hypothetical protein [Streptomyces lydicus]